MSILRNARVRQRFTISHEIAHYLLHARRSGKAQLFIDKQVTYRRDDQSSAGVNREEVEANQLGGEPHVGLSATMRKMSSRSSTLTPFLPARTRCQESQVQYSLKPARCHRTTVSGWTRINTSSHRDQNRRNITQKSLSVTAR
ncbi:MAG: ImmA/IrrE family metallo-endopeptidase [Silvibacterium sp.]|jgi:hypothetical protein